MRIVIAAIVLATVLLACTCPFVVDQTEFVVVTRFGAPVRTLIKPGLYWKSPWPIDTPVRFDNRLMVLENPAPGQADKEYLTSYTETPVGASASGPSASGGDAQATADASQKARIGKNVIVTTYTCWRIMPDGASVRTFLETMRDRASAEARLGDVVVSELGAALGRSDFSELVSVRLKPGAWAAFLDPILQRCRERVEKAYGIQVVDIKIERLNFPEQNRRNVFERMRAERETIATRYRSEGEERATAIRAAANRQRDEILATANMQAEQVRGKADADAARIYAEAYGQDPEFYKFMRTLESYEKSLTEGTVAVLSARSDFLRLLNQSGPESSVGTPAESAQDGNTTHAPSSEK